MSDLKTFVDTLSNKYTTSCDEPIEREDYDVGFVEGWELACAVIRNKLDSYPSFDITPVQLYETLKEIRYNKNGSGQFSAPLKSEFTDYALRDIATRLHRALFDKNNA